MTGNNPKLGLVNVDVFAKFGPILSSHSQDNERKRNAGRTEGRNDRTTEQRKDITTEEQGESSIAPLFQSGAIKIRKIGIPLPTPVLLYKSGVQGGTHYTHMFSG